MFKKCISKMFFHLIIYLQLLGVLCQFGGYESGGSLQISLKKRETIPLHQLSFRRWNKEDNFNYRRTIDIRNKLDRQDRKIEQAIEKLKEQKQVDEERLDKLQHELRWLTINTDEGIGIGI